MEHREEIGDAGPAGGLRSQEWLQLLGSFVTSASEAIVITDAASIDPPGPRILYVNPAFTSMTGYSAEEVIGQTPRILQGPRTQRVMLDRIRAALSKGEPSRAELINYRKDGAEFWTELCIVPIRDRNGQVAYWAASKREVTERKLVEQALRRSEAMNQALLTAIPDLMFRISRDGVFLDFRPAKDIQPLVPPDEFLGRSISDIMPPELAGRCMASLRETFETGQTQTLEYQLTVQGALRDYEARLAVCGDNEALALVRDTTERKQFEQQLQQASKMEALGRLAGGVAHDFNNLLTIIGGYARVALETLAPDNPLRGDLEEIAKASDRATGLTQSLLAFSRGQVAQPRILDLNSVVSSMNKMLRRLVGPNVDFVTVLRPDLGRVKAEPGQIEQVLMNLVVNGMDAMEGQGRITIETGNVELGQEYSRTHLGVRPGPHVMLSVSDTGRGMDAETKGHLFEPFFTTKEPGKGTGLGLATVYGIVKQSGGDIDVFSEPGEGTRVRIYLPRLLEKELEAEPSTLVRRPLEGSETVLLVEDEAGVRKLLRELLLRSGYTVLEARNGRDALRISSEHSGPIDLLLTDVVMPEMHGGELAQRIRGLRPDLRVLYVSGYLDDPALRSEAAGSGGGFLQKPFAPETLLNRIREVLDVSDSSGQEPCDPSAR